ncbi:hypothetical protein Trydic_g17408 [Trypoxylus dichotomus]
MDEFLQLNWGIKEPHELETTTEFLPEEEIASSYVFTGIPNKENPEIVKAKSAETVVKNSLVPGEQYTYNTPTKSFLRATEQEKCLTVLKLMQANKKPTGRYEQACMELYNNCHQRILEENGKFLRFAEKHFENSLKSKTFKLKPSLRTYAESLWKHKLKRCKDYKQFYKGIDMLPYSYKEDEESIELLHVGNLLELGTLAKFSGPTLLKPYILKRNTMPKVKVEYHSNQSVSKDMNIHQLVMSNKVDVIISSSGLTRLLNFTETKTPWDIPVVVKEVEVQNSDGTKKTKKVVFIDKPFPSQTPTIFELNETCFKVMLKSNFCDSEAFKFPNVETPIGSYTIYNNMRNTQGDNNDNEAKLSNETTIDSKDCKRKHNEKNEDDEKTKKVKLVHDEVNEDDEKTRKAKLEYDKVNEDDEKTKKFKLEHDEGPQLAESKKQNNFHHNVSYRLWKLQLNNEQCELMKAKYQTNSINMLVRCKLDACESGPNEQLQPTNVIPKMEYHLEYGGGIPTRRELLKQWVYAHFRPYCQVRRVRTHYNTGEVIAIENCTSQKIALDAHTHYQINLHLGLGVLYKIFSRFTNLTCGDYILHHLTKDGAFVALLRETTEDDDFTFNLYEKYNIDKCRIDSNSLKRWHPIDVNFILPRHIAEKQMPGMFKPCLVKQFTKNMKKGKGKKKKKKNKRKAKADGDVIVKNKTIE